VERIYKAYGKNNVSIVGISQNPQKDTAAFIKEYGLSFPVLLDDTHSYPVSNAYGLTNVPSLFWIAPDGEIEISSVGWLKKDIDDINRRAAETNGSNLQPLLRAGESVPDFRAG
jgi:peroxiredoxin